MEDRRIALAAKAAKLDAFLARAMEEFGHNGRDRDAMDRRIDAHIQSRLITGAKESLPVPVEVPAVKWAVS